MILTCWSLCCCCCCLRCPQRIDSTHNMLPDKDGPGVGGGQSSPEGEDPSVSLFREYLRLKTVHPDPDYGEISSSQCTKHQAMPFGNVTVIFAVRMWTIHFFLCCHFYVAIVPLEMLPLSDHITLHSCSLKAYCRWDKCSSLYPFTILCAVISQSPILICACYILNVSSYVWSSWCW